MKNKIIKSYSLFLLIFLFSASVFATCDTELDSSFDSTKPECFDFEKGDYSTITNWEQIDQAQIPIGRIQEVPPEHLAYFQLSSEQKLEMTSDQISKNFNLIVNLASDVNPEKAKEAIKKLYGITITSLSQGANLKDGTLSATFGNLDNVPLSLVSETTEVEIDDDGNILLKGETTPPAEGSYTAVYNDFTIITTPDGNELNVYGKISFNNGQTYLREDVGATINGITIANKGYYFSD